MNLYRSKCESCGDESYIFPDQIAEIKKNDNLALHKYCKEKLYIGAPWFCVKCDASKKDGKRCKISAHLTGDKAKNLIEIRNRGANLEKMGFYLPKDIV